MLIAAFVLAMPRGYRIWHNIPQVRCDQAQAAGFLVGGFLGVAGLEGPRLLRAARGSALGFILAGAGFVGTRFYLPADHDVWK